jgi:dolichol-phosphate mannosyltransferase
MATTAGADNGRALVVVPTYNERDTIGEVIARLFEAADHRVEVLVVDDGSPDGTEAVVRQLQTQRGGIHLLERSSKQGLGTAYIEGFREGIDKGYWAIVEMDADLSHDPAVVPQLLAALSDADLAIGSRYTQGGQVHDWSPARRWLSRAGNIYARAWLGFPIKDATSGFRAYRSDFLSRQDLDSVRSQGYGFQIEMARRIYRSGGRIVEVPITFTDRTLGRSKMNGRILLEAMATVTTAGIHDRVVRRVRSGNAE